VELRSAVSLERLFEGAAEEAGSGIARPAGGGTVDVLGDIAAGLAAQAWLSDDSVSLVSLANRRTGAFYDADVVAAAYTSSRRLLQRELLSSLEQPRRASAASQCSR
jgi:hypothetical protein